MPFVKPCTDDKNNVVVKNAVIVAIEKMAKAGYCHEDLRFVQIIYQG